MNRAPNVKQGFEYFFVMAHKFSSLLLLLEVYKRMLSFQHYILHLQSHHQKENGFNCKVKPNSLAPCVHINPHAPIYHLPFIRQNKLALVIVLDSQTGMFKIVSTLATINQQFLLFPSVNCFMTLQELISDHHALKKIQFCRSPCY